MRVLFVAPYPVGSADTRYRIQQFIPGLRQAGIQAEVRSFMSDYFFEIYARSGHGIEKLVEFAQALTRRLLDGLIGRRFDVVVIHKEAFPFGPPILERLLQRQAGAPCNCDLMQRIARIEAGRKNHHVSFNQLWIVWLGFRRDRQMLR